MFSKNFKLKICLHIWHPWLWCSVFSAHNASFDTIDCKNSLVAPKHHFLILRRKFGAKLIERPRWPCHFLGYTVKRLEEPRRLRCSRWFFGNSYEFLQKRLKEFLHYIILEFFSKIPPGFLSEFCQILFKTSSKNTNNISSSDSLKDSCKDFFGTFLNSFYRNSSSFPPWTSPEILFISFLRNLSKKFAVHSWRSVSSFFYSKQKNTGFNNSWWNRLKNFWWWNFRKIILGAVLGEILAKY